MTDPIADLIEITETLALGTRHQDLADQVEAAIQRVKQETASRAWQSIKTAPVDGTEILATDHDSIDIIHADGRHWETRDGEFFYPCFWQPMPAVPELIDQHYSRPAQPQP